MITLVIVALPVLLAFLVLMINVAWMQLMRTELRVATDAAADAGMLVMASTGDPSLISQAAVSAGQQNSVAGAPLILADTDVQFGRSERGYDGLWSFEQQTWDSGKVNALRITGRRAKDAPGGAVPFLFSGVFSSTVFEPTMAATVTRLPRDYVLVLDNSASMLYPSVWDGDPETQEIHDLDRKHAIQGPLRLRLEDDIDTSRWADMNRATLVFLEALENTPEEEMVGLVVAGEHVRPLVELTTEYDSIRDELERWKPNWRTSNASGVLAGCRMFERSGPADPYIGRTVVLLGDGIRTWGIQFQQAGRYLRDQGVTMDGITIGYDSTHIDMRHAIKHSGGSLQHAADEAELKQLLRRFVLQGPALSTE